MQLKFNLFPRSLFCCLCLPCIMSTQLVYIFLQKYFCMPRRSFGVSLFFNLVRSDVACLGSQRRGGRPCAQPSLPPQPLQLACPGAVAGHLRGWARVYFLGKYLRYTYWSMFCKLIFNINLLFPSALPHLINSSAISEALGASTCSLVNSRTNLSSSSSVRSMSSGVVRIDVRTTRQSRAVLTLSKCLTKVPGSTLLLLSFAEPSERSADRIMRRVQTTCRLALMLEWQWSFERGDWYCSPCWVISWSLKSLVDRTKLISTQFVNRD